MVHNGIEYGDMQLIGEAYALMKQALGMSADDMHQLFNEWNLGELNSYLIEITADIFTQSDASGVPLVDTILDQAGQKGTGKMDKHVGARPWRRGGDNCRSCFCAVYLRDKERAG